MNGDRLSDLPNLSPPPEHGSARFEIDELAGLVSHHLVSVDCGAAISLARTCKMLEVPTLSSMWEQVRFEKLQGTHDTRLPHHQWY